MAAGHPAVRSAVALAPWVLRTDVPEGLEGRRILIVHGSADRIASPQRSAALAERLRHTARVGYVVGDGGKHAMLRHHDKFGALTADFVIETSSAPPATTCWPGWARTPCPSRSSARQPGPAVRGWHLCVGLLPSAVSPAALPGARSG